MWQAKVQTAFLQGRCYMPVTKNQIERFCNPNLAAVAMPYLAEMNRRMANVQTPGMRLTPSTLAASPN